MELVVELLKQYGITVALLGLNLYFTYRLYGKSQDLSDKFHDIESSLKLGDQRMTTLELSLIHI